MANDAEYDRGWNDALQELQVCMADRKIGYATAVDDLVRMAKAKSVPPTLSVVPDGQSEVHEVGSEHRQSSQQTGFAPVRKEE
jgi:hypothetical protein